MYEAFAQMGVKLHNDTIEIVETSVSFPIHVEPYPGMFIYSSRWKGLLPIAHVFYDADRKAYVMAIGVGAYDYTMTLEEWLTERPYWKKAENPLIDMIPRDEKPSEPP